MTTRYLLKSPTGQFFQHSPAAAVSAWTESPATAHQWVDFDRASEAADRWHQLHGETLAVVQKP